MIGFNIKPGTSAEDLALRKKMAAQLAQGGMSTEPVGHWTQGLARALQGGLGGLEMAQIERKEGQQRQEGNQALVDALGGGAQGGRGEMIARLLANPNTAGVGQKLVAEHLSPQKSPNSMKEFELAQSNPAYAQFLDRRSPQTNVNVKNMGTIPPGFQVEYDAQGRPARMIPIEGSPAAREIEDKNRAAAERKKNEQTSANLVISTIDEAVEKIKASPVTTTGVGGALLSNLPQTEAGNVAGLINTVKANAGFDRLQQMRNASPTGGALGQVSERELMFLQSTIGDLEQSRTTDQVLKNLGKVRDAYNQIIHGSGGGGDGGWKTLPNGVKIREKK